VLSEVPVNDVPAKLRAVLLVALGAGMIAVAVAIVFSFHLRLPKATPPQSSFSAKPIPKNKLLPQNQQPTPGFHVPLSVILYILLVVVLVAAVLLSIWWSRRFGPSFGGRTSGFLAEDPEDLREAVESGRSALRTIDDARAAIIACYVAMESSLAERGAARAVADTPDELLARATTSGLVRGTAASRLTALFYEARFSSHPLGRGQRDAAERALDELAAALASAHSQPAESQPAEPRQAEPRP
jgi:flagellar basal body-associated protein FliL